MKTHTQLQSVSLRLERFFTKAKLTTLFFLLISLLFLSLSSCSDSTNDDDTMEEEVDDTDDESGEEMGEDDTDDDDASAENPLDGMGEVVAVTDGSLISTEGPVWHAASESLFFTDIPGNTIYSLDVNTEELSVLRSPSNNSNGLAIDADGFLIIAEQGIRIVTRMNLTTNEVTPYIESVNLDGEDKQFNSPNDLAIHSNGNIYFTDPSFGLGDNESETGFNGFYVRTPDGNVELLRTFEYETEQSPNGVILSPDESTLYLAVSHNTSAPILAYDVDADGNLSNEREFATGQNSDGMAIDEEGNLYVATLTGVEVWSPEGEYWGIIQLPDTIRTTNVAFGTTEMNTLYITNRSSDVYAVALNVVGHQ